MKISFLKIVILVYLYIRLFTRADDNYCMTSSMADFVRDSIPTICFNSDSAGILNYSMDNVEFYHAHCRVYHELKSCVETKLKHCDEIKRGFTKHVLNLIESYQLPLEYFDYTKEVYDNDHYLLNLLPFCDGNQLSRHFAQQFNRSLLNCITNTTINKHKQCLSTFKANTHSTYEVKASLGEITKWSEDFLRCVYNSIPSVCPTATKEVFIFRELLAVDVKQNTSTTLNITKIVKQKLPGQNIESFAQSKRATTSIHGDPHIVQLHTKKAVTCKLLHNNTYLSNPHFKITGIANHVGDPLFTATALTALQIDFFNSNSSLIAFYRGVGGKLPFKINYIDSLLSSIIKIDHGEKHSTEGHVTITHIPTSTQIIVNVWAKYYFFIVRSSELILNNSNGYLITGCPKTEVIDREAMIDRLRQRFEQSQKIVSIGQIRQRRQINLNEFELPKQCEQTCSFDGNDFYNECLFDCLALATFNVTQALRVNELHQAASQGQRKLIENDEHAVKQFKECYKKDVLCKKLPDIDSMNDTSVIYKQSLFIVLFSIFLTNRNLFI